MALSKLDKTALLRVVKGRFELLDYEVNRRSAEVRRQIRLEVQQESEDKIARYRNLLEELEAKATALRKEARDLGEDARKEGLKLGGHSSSDSPLANVSVYMEVMVADEEKIVEERFQAFRVRGKLNGGLRELELKITEELLVMDLEGDAKSFLAEIPKLDEVLPPPEQRLIEQ